jgi:hypothetical protein
MSDLPDVSITTIYSHLSLAAKNAATLALQRASSSTKRKDSWPDAPLGPSRFSITRLPSSSEAAYFEAGAMRGQTLGKVHPPKVGRLRRWLLLLLPFAVVLNYVVFRADAPYLLWGSRLDATVVLRYRDGDLRREGGGELLRDKMALESRERLRELQRKEWGEGRDGQTVGLGMGGWETSEDLGGGMEGVSEEGVSRKQMEASKDASEDGGDDDDVHIKRLMSTPLVERALSEGGTTGESVARITEATSDPHSGGGTGRGSGLLMQDEWDDDEEEGEGASSGEGLPVKEEARSVKEEGLGEEQGMLVRSAGDEGALKLTEGEGSGGHISFKGGVAAERGTAGSKNQSSLAESRIEDAGKGQVSNSGMGLGQGLENPREGRGQGYSDAQEVRSEAQSAQLSHGGAAGSGAEPSKSVKVSKPRRYLYFSETIDDGQTGGLIHQVCMFSLCFLASSLSIIEPRKGYLSFGITNRLK